MFIHVHVSMCDLHRQQSFLSRRSSRQKGPTCTHGVIKSNEWIRRTRVSSFPEDQIARLKLLNPEPNETKRLEVLKMHATNAIKRGNIDCESVVKLADGLGGADVRNFCTEAGQFAIRDYRDCALEKDFATQKNLGQQEVREQT